MKLTKSVVDRAEPRERAYALFDSQIKGLELRVYPSGVKTFCLSYREPPGGRAARKKRLTIGRYGTIAPDQARRLALDALAAIHEGRDPQSEKVRARGALTVGQLVEMFLRDHVQVHRRPATLAQYRHVLAHVVEAHGREPVDRLTRAMMSKLHAELGATSPISANRMLAAVSSMWSWAQGRGLIPESTMNPAARITRFKEQPKERYLSVEELSRLGKALRECENVSLFARLAIRLLLLTGARLREILDAKWANVDWERGALRLETSKTGPRWLQLPDAALDLLRQAPRVSGNPHIIPGHQEGRPRRDLCKPLAALAKAAGVGSSTAHMCRHTYASHAAGRGTSLYMVGKLLGHTQAQTSQRYAHMAQDPLRAAANAVGAALTDAMGDSDA